MPDEERQVFEAIVEKGDARLVSITNSVFQGLITGWNKVYVGEIVGEDDEHGVVEFLPEGGDQPEIVEEKLLRRLVKGREIDHWGVDWEGLWLLFPYEVESGKAHILTKETLQGEYPQTWTFLKNHEDELKGREGGKWEDEEQWWTFGRSQNLAKMELDKIMTNIMSDYNRFSVDTEGKYYFIGGGNAGGYGVELIEDFAPSSDDHLYYAALLNSRVLEYWHKHIAPIFGGKYYSYNKRYLEPHPVVLPENAPAKEIRETARDIKEVRELITELEYKTSDVRNYLADYDRSAVVLDLAQSIELSDDNYRQSPIRKDSKTEEEGTEELYRVVMKRGHHIEFLNEQVRDFVFELIKAEDRRLTRSEVLNMGVPSRSGVMELMHDYQRDQERIRDIEAQFEELRAELDKTVLRDSYELELEEGKLIDGFLEIW